MAEPPDFSELAKRYVDLWQDHLMAIAGDPALADSMARLFGGAVPWPPFAGAAGERICHCGRATAAAAAASLERDRNVVPARAAALAALEERLAAAEARSRRTRPVAAKKPRLPSRMRRSTQHSRRELRSRAGAPSSTASMPIAIIPIAATCRTRRSCGRMARPGSSITARPAIPACWSCRRSSTVPIFST